MESGNAGQVATTESTSGGTTEPIINTAGRTREDVTKALLTLGGAGLGYVIVDGVRRLGSDLLTALSDPDNYA